MSTFTITDQDKKLLDFISKGEAARGGDPYASVFPSRIIPEILQMSIQQIFEFQEHRTRSKSKGGLGLESSACGRYQFIRSTLQDVVKQAGVPLTTRYNSTCQDYLILKRLEFTRQLNQWKSGAITDVAFCLNLAKEFASIPVPIATQGAKRAVSPGESFYAGVGSNRSVGHANVSVILQELADIRTGGAGSSFTGDLAQGSGPFPAGGSSPLSQTELAATGGQPLWGAGPTDRRAPNSSLPGVGNVYQYNPIHPLDNRYDFRTGEKVRDLLYNGINPQSASAYVSGNGLAPVNDLGVSPLDPNQLKSSVENRSIVGYNTGEVDPGLVEALRKNLVSPSTSVPQVQPPKFGPQ